MSSIIKSLVNNSSGDPTKGGTNTCLIQRRSDGKGGILINGRRPSNSNSSCVSPSRSSIAGSVQSFQSGASSNSTSTSLKFAPLPESGRQRRASISMGVAARASLLQGHGTSCPRPVQQTQTQPQSSNASYYIQNGQTVPWYQGGPNPDNVYTAKDIIPGVKKALRKLSRSRSCERRSSAEPVPAGATADKQKEASQVVQIEDICLDPDTTTTTQSDSQPSSCYAIREEPTPVHSRGGSRVQSRRGSLDMTFIDEHRAQLRQEILGFDSFHVEPDFDRRQSEAQDDCAVFDDDDHDDNVQGDDVQDARGRPVEAHVLDLSSRSPRAPHTSSSGMEIDLDRPTTKAGHVEKVI